MEADTKADADAQSAASALVLPATLDLTNVAELKAQLEAALANSPDLVLDASAVQRVTTPSLQLLAAAKQSFAGAGGTGMKLETPSAAFVEAVRTLALGPLFELSEE